MRARALATSSFAMLAVAPVLGAPAEHLVHRYLEVVLSPDAKFVASVEGDSPVGGYYPDARELVIRGVKGRSQVRVALPCGHASGCWPGSLAWQRDGRRLAFALRLPGRHAYEVYTVAQDGTSVLKVVDFSGTVTDLRYGQHNTLAMLAVENAQKEPGASEAAAPLDPGAAPTEQRIAIVEEGALKWASPVDLHVYEYDWIPDEAGFVGTAAPGDGDSNWWTAKLYRFTRQDTSAHLLVSPPSIREQLATPRVSPNGSVVAYISGLMSDFGTVGGDVYALGLNGQSPVRITPGIHGSATAIAWSCKGDLRAELLVGDERQVVSLGAGRNASTPRVLLADHGALRGEASIHSSACPHEVTASVRESFVDPPEIEVSTPQTSRVLTTVNHLVSPSSRAISVHWTNGGFEEQGWLLLPKPLPSSKMPMVTVVHGGPAFAWTPSFTGPGITTSMLERGWAVFRPNPRGSFGQGESFTAANVRDFGQGDLNDILAGLDAAERAASIDEERLGIMGSSYGGFMTMWAVTQTNRFKVAVAAAGISNWQSYYGENGIDQWLLPYFGASVYDDPDAYARSSPINFVRQAKTPTFVFGGDRDLEVPVVQSVEFWHALKTLGVPVSIAIYPGEGHVLRDPSHAEDATARTLNWLTRYLN